MFKNMKDEGCIFKQIAIEQTIKNIIGKGLPVNTSVKKTMDKQPSMKISEFDIVVIFSNNFPFNYG